MASLLGHQQRVGSVCLDPTPQDWFQFVLRRKKVSMTLLPVAQERQIDQTDRVKQITDQSWDAGRFGSPVTHRHTSGAYCDLSEQDGIDDASDEDMPA